MADISKIKTIDGTTYNIKDSVARLEPIETKTYTDIIATSDDHRYAAFFYLRVRPDSYTERWRVMLRVNVTVPGSAANAALFAEETTTEIWGAQSVYGGYYNVNKLTSASYKPLGYHSAFFASSTGYNNNCSHWIGVNLKGATSPIDTNYKRQIVVELLQYENCEVEFVDTLYTPDTIPNRSAHTSWYTSTNTSFTHFDAYTQGIRMAGDQNTNTTSIHALYRYYGTYVADSVVYRYQLLFHTDENTLTPLNNVSNGYNKTKSMLTEVEFDPFMPIYYYNSTTTVSAGNSISASSSFYHYAGVDARYTFNTGSTLTAQRPLYLVVSPTSNGKCKIASTTPWAQALPSVSDGNWYVFLGRTYSTSAFTLYQDHPVYMYDGTKVVRVSPYTAITTAEIDAITNS